MHHHRQQQPHGIYNDVSLSTVDLLASVIATRPPFSVVLTDWLSMMAALGVGLLPSAFELWAAGPHGLVPMYHPVSIPRKYHHTVPQGGRSCGMARHVQPMRRTYTMPLTTSRRSTVRGLPRSWLMGVGKPEHPTVRRSGRWGMVCVSYLHSNTCPRLLTHPLTSYRRKP